MRLFDLSHNTRVGLAATASAAALASVVVLRAQQPAANRPMVPLTAATILQFPDAHIGENASLMAAVEQTLSKTVFSVDQDRTKSTGKELLVIAPTLQSAVKPNSYLTIVGEVIKFDPEEVARKARGYTLDLPADAIEKFKGKPAVIATSIVTAELTDLAKRLPPPMTPAEVALSNTMKGLQPASGALRQALDGSSADAAKAQTAILKKSFADVEAFFKARNTADAIGWAQEGQKLSDAIDQAVAGGKWDAAKASATSITSLCSSCHAAHRERFDDGSYRVKGN
jgi:hypothetical protein